MNYVFGQYYMMSFGTWQILWNKHYINSTGNFLAGQDILLLVSLCDKYIFLIMVEGKERCEASWQCFEIEK